MAIAVVAPDPSPLSRPAGAAEWSVGGISPRHNAISLVFSA
jgi:hypothetical protein